MVCFMDQVTRNIAFEQLIKALTTKSILSNTHSTFSTEEATATAKIIEEESYNAAIASTKSGSGDDDNGIELFNVYAKEISRRAGKVKGDKRLMEQHQKEIQNHDVVCRLDQKKF